MIETRLGRRAGDRRASTCRPQQLGLVDWLYRNGDVVRRADHEDGGVSLALRMTAAARSDMETRLHRRNKGLQQ